MPTEKRQLGDRGEARAAEFLRRAGYRILARQARMGRWGEIDLVAQDGATLVFVEVKTRTTAEYGAPEEALTAGKRRALARAIEAFRLSKGWEQWPFRADVVAVDLAGASPTIRHLKSVALT